MANKDAFVVVRFGWQEYVMPKDAGMAVFKAMTENPEIYSFNTTYRKNTSVPVITPLSFDMMPSIRSINAAQMLHGIETAKDIEEEKQQKEAEKKANNA